MLSTVTSGNADGRPHVGFFLRATLINFVRGIRRDPWTSSDTTLVALETIFSRLRTAVDGAQAMAKTDGFRNG